MIVAQVRDKIEFLSRVQLEVAVRGLLTMTLPFVAFVLYQQVLIMRLRAALVAADPKRSDAVD